MSDADALKAARAAVDAARSLRDQMREDWGHAGVDRLERENARLRAVVDAVRVLVEQSGEWYDADMGTEPYNRLMAALTRLDYSDGDRAKAQLDGSAVMGGGPSPSRQGGNRER